MKTPFPAFDSEEFIREIGTLNKKIIEGVRSFTEIEDVDVGTAPMDLVFQEDKVKLFHYRPERPITCRIPVLMVYALVNRQYMLDLQPDRSLVRNLLQHGVDVYIVDWGYPTKADMYLTLDDYIDEYLQDCVDSVRETSGQDKLNLMGICQGGTFCAIYAALYPHKVKNLITVVAPFDFSPNDGLLFSWSRHMNVDALVDVYRVVPGDLLNEAYMMLMPFTLNIKKYKDMLDIIEDKDKLLNFLRMEKWIFDSPGQAGECFREFIKDFYQKNKLIKGEITIGGVRVDLSKITMPLLNIYASADHLVPPSTVKPLNDFVGTADKTLYEFEGGHIGVFVGSKSQQALGPFISKWVHSRQNGDHIKERQVPSGMPTGNDPALPVAGPKGMIRGKKKGKLKGDRTKH